MNSETEDFLRNTAAKQEAAKMRPAIEKQAMEEYHLLGDVLRGLVGKFNSSPIATKTNISLKLEGPHSQYDTNMFTLHLNGGKAYPGSRALVIYIPHSIDFNHTRLGVITWQSHISLEGLKSDLSGYAPHDRPEKLGKESYKMVPMGETHGWIKENGAEGDAVTFKTLFDNLVYQLVIHNMGVSNQ